MRWIIVFVICFSLSFQFSCSDQSNDENNTQNKDTKNGGSDQKTDEEKLPDWLKKDGVFYAGIGNADLLDYEFETHNEETGNSEYDGCYDSNEKTSKCKETFNDLDGSGTFDAIFVAGFGNERVATGIHDPVKATALFLSKDDDYMIFVGLDLVGLMYNRVLEARQLLEDKGFDPSKVIIASSHNHEGPDTVGYWGNPLAKISGVNKEFQNQIAAKILKAVEAAVAARQKGGRFKMLKWDRQSAKYFPLSANLNIAGIILQVY